MKPKKLKLRSRNKSCIELKTIETGNKRVLYRMGSTTPTEVASKYPIDIEINTAEACRVSGNKILMKQAFDSWNNTNPNNHIPNAEWVQIIGAHNEHALEDLKNVLDKWEKMIIKHIHSSKGNGIYFVQTKDELEDWYNEHMDIDKYVFEKYYTYSKEYRLHVTNDGCFYTCRKMLKNDAEVRWHRHENNSVWILEDNPLFSKPSNWDAIVAACISAKNAVGLDIAAVDVKVQTKDNPNFIILETNSAPALGEVGVIKYKELLNKYIFAND